MGGYEVPQKVHIATIHTLPKGFTLTEMAIVLIIVGLLMATIASVGATRTEIARNNTTEERLYFLLKTIEDFIDINGYIPCPAAGNLSTGDATYGNSVGGATDTDCNDGTANLPERISGLAIGMIPFNDLGLPPAIASDGWNNRFTYVVDESFAGHTYYDANPTADGTIVIRKPSGSTADGVLINNTAVLAIISHGSNGFGAWRHPEGTRITYNGGPDDEDKNVKDDALTAPYNTNHFVQSRTLLNFDDIVVYRTRWHLEE